MAFIVVFLNIEGFSTAVREPNTSLAQSFLPLIIVWFAGMITNCLVDDKQFLRLAHLAPLSAFSLIKSKFLALIIYVMAGSLVIIGVMGVSGSLCWKTTLLLLPSLLIGGALPLIAIGLLIESLFSLKRYSLWDWDPPFNCKLVLSLIAWFFWMGIAHGFGEPIAPLLAAAISVGLILTGSFVSYFTLRLVARRLARIEWL